MRMKNGMILAICVALLGTACSNEEKKPEPPTVAPIETTSPTTTTPVPGKEKEAETEINVGPNGADMKTKDGTSVSVSDTGGSMGTKKVKIGVKTK